MKKNLTILLIFLAISSLSIAVVPAAQSQTQSVQVLSYTYYWDSLGYLIVVGEVQNQGPNVIDKIILTGIVTGDQGSQISSYCQVYGNNLLPNQKAPFYLEFYPQTQDGQNFVEEISTIELSVYSAEPTAKHQYPDLTITNQQSYIGTDPGTAPTANNPGTGDLGVYWVTGTIQNTGTETAQNITIVGTFYNSAGKVVAVGLSDTKNAPSVPASQSKTFKLGAYDLNQSVVPAEVKIATYSLLVQNIGPMDDGPPPVIPPTATPPAVSTAPTNANGSIDANTNGSQIPSLVYGVIAAVAIAAVAAALLLMRKRSKTQAISSYSKPKPKKPNSHR